MRTVEQVASDIRVLIEAVSDPMPVIDALRQAIHAACPVRSQPVDRVRWVPLDEVRANDYNPNIVAYREMGLLYQSISKDGYTQPVVTIYDARRRKYIIVDGFHRYSVCRLKEDIRTRNLGLLPIVVLDKSINERMASTIRHNRARGEHTVTGMGKLVFEMLDGGWDDSEICNQIGLDPDELLKLKHVTGFSKLFKDAKYSQAWETRRQIHLRRKYEESLPEKPVPT